MMKNLFKLLLLFIFSLVINTVVAQPPTDQQITDMGPLDPGLWPDMAIIHDGAHNWTIKNHTNCDFDFIANFGVWITDANGQNGALHFGNGGGQFEYSNTATRNNGNGTSITTAYFWTNWSFDTNHTYTIRNALLQVKFAGMTSYVFLDISQSLTGTITTQDCGCVRWTFDFTDANNSILTIEPC